MQPRKPDLSKPCPIPFFDTSVKAGFPSPAEDYLEQKLDLNHHLIQHPAATFFVRVEGDSMQGAGIQRDDILIVDRALEPANGKIALVVLDGEFTVKRLRFTNGQLFLDPENPRYPSIAVSNEADFLVWGIVTYVIHKAV